MCLAVVDVVIGVDTHVHTHSAAVIDAATGGVLDEITVDATARGYAELVEFANTHATLRAWVIEGTGGHGAGLSRHLLEMSEIVIELDRRASPRFCPPKLGPEVHGVRGSRKGSGSRRIVRRSSSRQHAHIGSGNRDSDRGSASLVTT